VEAGVVAVKMKAVLKIYSTNWIHLVGFLSGSYIYLAIRNIFFPERTTNTFEDWLTGILMLPVFFLTYGLVFLLAFVAIMFILDTLFFINNKEHILRLLFWQWFIIVLQPITWAFEYRYWLWIVLSVTFFITQYIRSKKIKNIILKPTAKKFGTL